MASGSQNKRKAHQSHKKEGYYKNQFLVTSRNKIARGQRRKRRLESQPKQKHPVKPNAEARMIRRNVRDAQARIARHRNRQLPTIIVVMKKDSYDK